MVVCFGQKGLEKKPGSFRKEASGNPSRQSKPFFVNYMKKWVWLKSLWWYVSDATKQLPNDAQISVGKRELHTTLAGIDIGLHNLRAQLLVKLERQ